MPTKRIIPLNKIEGVAAGGTATIDLPTNVRYHGIVLQYDTTTAGGATEANMETEISEVRLNLGQVTQRKASAAHIFDINRTKGKTPTVGDGTAPGYIPLFFSEPQRESQIEREATAWGMQGIDDFQIEVDIVNNAAQTPSLKGFAIVDDVQEAPRGIVKWKRNTLTIAATGETPFKLSTVGGDSYQGLHFFEQANGDIDELLLEWDGVKLYQLTEYQDDALMAQFADGFTKVSGNVFVPLDFNHPADALRTTKMVNGARVPVQELIATLNMGAANNVTLIREMVGLPD
jgi:hypothetical protein